jgi:hypothetical protein
MISKCSSVTLKKWFLPVTPFFNSRVDFSIFDTKIRVFKERFLR